MSCLAVGLWILSMDGLLKEIMFTEAKARRIKALWWLWRWGTPLPIPNREVKPTSADGTAFTGGRVSRCHSFIKTPCVNLGFFYAKSSTNILYTKTL
jgi:hypothetical protein